MPFKFLLCILSVSLTHLGWNTSIALISYPYSSPLLSRSSVLTLCDLIFIHSLNSEQWLLCERGQNSHLCSLDFSFKHQTYFSISLLVILLLVGLPILQIPFVQTMSLPPHYSQIYAQIYALPRWKPELCLTFPCPLFSTTKGLPNLVDFLESVCFPILFL